MFNKNLYSKKEIENKNRQLKILERKYQFITNPKDIKEKYSIGEQIKTIKLEMAAYAISN